jgi:hypothetical protein
VPVWGLWVDGTLYFGGGPRSRKVRNLSQNPNVVVHLESGSNVVVLEGVAEPVTAPDPMLTERLSAASADKYGISGGNEGYYAVRPSVVLAWSEGGFPRTATRWVLG